MLIKEEIIKEIKKKNISIKKNEIELPLDALKINPNSINLTLAPKIFTPKRFTLSFFDTKNKDRAKMYKEITIPEKGIMLKKGRLYLMSSNEFVSTGNDLVVIAYGRSGSARIGINATSGAGLGDVGYCGVWTLCMTPSTDIIVHEGDELAQLTFHRVTKSKDTYNGSYQNSKKASTSKI